jgi:hypothetical protein
MLREDGSTYALAVANEYSRGRATDAELDVADAVAQEAAGGINEAVEEGHDGLRRRTHLRFWAARAVASLTRRDGFNAFSGVEEARFSRAKLPDVFAERVCQEALFDCTIGGPQRLPPREFSEEVRGVALACHLGQRDAYPVLADQLDELGEAEAAEYCRTFLHPVDCRVVRWVLYPERYYREFARDATTILAANAALATYRRTHGDAVVELAYSLRDCGGPGDVTLPFDVKRRPDAAAALRGRGLRFRRLKAWRLRVCRDEAAGDDVLKGNMKDQTVVAAAGVTEAARLLLGEDT